MTLNQWIRKNPYTSAFFIVLTLTLIAIPLALTGFGVIPAGFGLAQLLFPTASTTLIAALNWSVTTLTSLIAGTHVSFMLLVLHDFLQSTFFKANSAKNQKGHSTSGSADNDIAIKKVASQNANDNTNALVASQKETAPAKDKAPTPKAKSPVASQEETAPAKDKAPTPKAKSPVASQEETAPAKDKAPTPKAKSPVASQEETAPAKDKAPTPKAKSPVASQEETAPAKDKAPTPKAKSPVASQEETAPAKDKAPTPKAKSPVASQEETAPAKDKAPTPKAKSPVASQEETAPAKDKAPTPKAKSPVASQEETAPVKAKTPDASPKNTAAPTAADENTTSKSSRKRHNRKMRANETNSPTTPHAANPNTTFQKRKQPRRNAKETPTSDHSGATASLQN